MEDAKILAAAFNGVMKRDFEGDSTITPEFLLSALFPSPPAPSLSALSQFASQVSRALSKAAYEDYDPTQLEAYLVRIKTSDPALTKIQRECLVRFWRANRGRAREALRKRATAGSNGFDRMAWRIDSVVRRSRGVGDEESNTTAIVEMRMTGPPPENRPVVARFEMSREQLGEVLQKVADVEADIASASAAVVGGGTATSAPAVAQND